MRWFPLTYSFWKLRMLRNLLQERREYLALFASAILLGSIGLIGFWNFSSDRLYDLLTEKSPREANRLLSLTTFTIYVTYLFMGLANVISRFFSQPRLEEREQLMGPISARMLFLTELADAVRLPLFILMMGIVVPLLLVAVRLQLPWWVILISCSDLIVLYIQPTLLIMALYIAVIRFIPGTLLNRQGLLFLFFFVVAGIGISLLDAIRSLYQTTESWVMFFPSSWPASVIPYFLSDQQPLVIRQSLRVHGLTLCLFFSAYVLYSYAFLNHLERFGLHLTHGDQQDEEPWLDRIIWRWVARKMGLPTAAIVIKDLRSGRRDTAQRIAFTGLAAVIFALIISDLLTGRNASNVFLLIFFFYAIFLISCQGLSTFSAEGGVLENLARFPLTASQILRAKMVSHFLLFGSVVLMLMGLIMLAPSPLPALFRVPAALLIGPLLLPFAVFLSWISVTLGAIFPKVGEGGGRKEISIFAMALFFQLTTLFMISIPLAVVTTVSFGPWYVTILLLVGIVWAGLLIFLYQMAERTVDRALGAEMRLR